VQALGHRALPGRIERKAAKDVERAQLWRQFEQIGQQANRLTERLADDHPVAWGDVLCKNGLAQVQTFIGPSGLLLQLQVSR
jgi:hypothetical protein